MATLTETQRMDIINALREYVGKYPSQNKAAASLRGVSAGTISQILNGKLELISEEMWRNIAAQVIMQQTEGWQVTDTKPFKEILFAMEDCQKYKNVTWVIASAGSGKSTAAKIYQNEHKEVFLVNCSDDMRKTDIVNELSRAVGLGQTDRSTSTRNLLMDIIDEIITMENPLIIFDEGDKLPDRTLQYFITLYNHLEDRCGIVFLSTNYMKRRMTYGLQYNKQGYQEIDSRLGRRFFDVDENTPKEVWMICQANGISDETTIKEIIGETQSCGFDLRRVKKAVHKAKRKNR